MHIPHHMPFAMAAAIASRDPTPKASEAEGRDYAWIADCLDASQRKKPRHGSGRRSTGCDLHEEFPGGGADHDGIAASPMGPSLMINSATRIGEAFRETNGNRNGALTPSDLNRLLDDLCRGASESESET